MAASNRRRRLLITLVLVVIALLLLLSQCLPRARTPKPPLPSAATNQSPAPTPRPAAPTAEQTPPAERLTPATLRATERTAAGAAFPVEWDGPDNPGDFVAIVKRDAPPEALGNYRETKEGKRLELTAPMDPGPHELRYIAARSRTILGRAPIEVEPVAASIDAPPRVVLGSSFRATWTGPDNEGDFITIVPRGAPDNAYQSYADTAKGSPAALTAPPDPGEAELRYVSGQGRTVLARRPITVVAAEVSLTAPDEAVAGSTIDVAWTGPNNAGDYITIVADGTPDGHYENYTETAKGSPLKLRTPIMDGRAEIRFMTGQGRRVLGRRPIRIVPAAVTLAAPEQCSAGSPVSIEWTGPSHPGDYITIVVATTPDGQYADYTETGAGSPLTVKAPKQPGAAEIRYMSGQGSKVLARIPINVIP